MQYAKPVTLNVEECDRLSFLTAPPCAGHHRRYEDERIFQNTSGAA
ncbi:hypothetical protein JRT73AECX_JRT73AEC_04837 [Escherichia coli]|nr:hypothetical protein JRT41CECX_JRT41CEC_04707 [Escherichia coli]CAJ1305478.1 hypothetical protein JRT73AECX_JRT73AEC_04837 [Escherichia coli]